MSCGAPCLGTFAGGAMEFRTGPLCCSGGRLKWEEELINAPYGWSYPMMFLIAGMPESACAASNPDMTADSMQPESSPVAVQSPAIVRLSNVISSGDIRWSILPGKDCT